MGPADSRTVSQEELLAQLWNYCRSIIQAADPHQRHIQVVFFDTFLSSTTFSVSFLDIKKLIQTVIMLRASSSFELFGLGCPGEEDVATSLGSLAAWFLFHRWIVSPQSLAAHLLDPVLWGKQFPCPLHLTTSPLTPAASAESADKGPAVQNDTAALLPGRLVEPQPDRPAPTSTQKRRSRCRCSSPQPIPRTSQEPAVVSNTDNFSFPSPSVCVPAVDDDAAVSHPTAHVTSPRSEVSTPLAASPSAVVAPPSSHPPAVTLLPSSSPAATSPPGPALAEQELGKWEELALPEPQERAPELGEREPQERAPELAVHVQRARHAVYIQHVGDYGPFYVAHQSCNAAATGPVAACRSCNATGSVAGHRSCHTAATGPVAARWSCSAAAIAPVAGRLKYSVAITGPEPRTLLQLSLDRM
ncbi:uncharacterized protein LOC120437549 isoform X2 [Oreochromis aureus]|uniref:uncharacterized protein LOC120437549 isoform X2 n=1 Tax=Oreochromis aureus TaxID=47969 RepID=UPI00195324FC|nr:uncharacterized protein LOC120437549 isoform X2 [Oreochromis aureus]